MNMGMRIELKTAVRIIPIELKAPDSMSISSAFAVPKA